MRHESSLPSYGVRCKLYNAVELLRFCCQLIDLSERESENYVVNDPEGFNLDFILEAGSFARTSVRLLQELIGGSRPTLPKHLFDAIRSHVTVRNFFPRVEQISLVLELATSELRDAVDEASNEGNEADYVWDVMRTVHRCVESQSLLFESATIWFGRDELLARYSGEKFVMA